VRDWVFGRPSDEVPAAQPPCSVMFGLLSASLGFEVGAGLRAGTGADLGFVVEGLGLDMDGRGAVLGFGVGADFEWLKVEAVGVLTLRGGVGCISASRSRGCVEVMVVVFVFGDKA
jgi:hypothetical protein